MLALAFSPPLISLFLFIWLSPPAPIDLLLIVVAFFWTPAVMIWWDRQFTEHVLQRSAEIDAAHREGKLDELFRDGP